MSMVVPLWADGRAVAFDADRAVDDREVRRDALDDVEEDLLDAAVSAVEDGARRDRAVRLGAVEGERRGADEALHARASAAPTGASSSREWR